MASVSVYPHGQISYQGNIVRLVDADRVADSLIVTKRDGQKIKGSIYAIDIVFWNSGNLSVGKTSDRLREPLNLELSPESGEIISSSVQKANFDEHILKLRQSYPFQEIFDWDQFDPGDAFRVSILFEGTDETTFRIAGKIVGVSLTNLSPPKANARLNMNGDYVIYGFEHNSTFRGIVICIFFICFVFPIFVYIISGVAKTIVPNVGANIFDAAGRMAWRSFIIGIIAFMGSLIYLIVYFATVYNWSSFGAPL